MCGFILDGVYYKDEPNLEKLRSNQQSGYKEWDRNRQRKDFAKEILQPYNRNGTPNEDFKQAYHEESLGYGFIPKNEDLIKE